MNTENKSIKHWMIYEHATQTLVFTKRVLFEAFLWSRSSVPGIPALMKVQSWNIETASRLDSFTVDDGHITQSLWLPGTALFSPNEMIEEVCRKFQANVNLNEVFHSKVIL